MNLVDYQSYVLPLIVTVFFARRFYRFRAIKKKLPKLLEEGAILIDVRSKEEYSKGHNSKSINIPLDEFADQVKKLDKSKTIILCCASGTRSGMALSVLKKNGFQNAINAGPWTK
jgi:rhodanese-related sulfurtransferase